MAAAENFSAEVKTLAAILMVPALPFRESVNTVLAAETLLIKTCYAKKLVPVIVMSETVFEVVATKVRETAALLSKLAVSASKQPKRKLPF